MKEIIEDLKWRYATKKYSASKKISTENIEYLKDTLQLAPSSYGIQPLRYFFIENKEVRTKLVPSAFGQQQVSDASHLLVMCSHKVIDDTLIDSYIQNIVSTRNAAEEKVKQFGKHIKNSITNMDEDQMQHWNAKQAYIALGMLLQSCAHLRIDATPMEGFDAIAVSKILHLKEKGLSPTLLVAMGYRHDEDQNQHLKKVRRSKSELFEVV